jgi:hypothetical protein
VVSNVGAASSASGNFNYFYVGPQNVVISPATGGMQGGTAVTISGQGFAVWPQTTSVTFGGVPALSVNCTSSTSCTAWAPPHDPGSVSVVVSASGSSMPSANNFTYVGPQITSVTPDSGPITGGTWVTVHGINMIDTAHNTLSVTGTIAGVSLGSVSCVREGQTDGSCSFITPPLATVPAHPIDIQLTVPNSTGTLVSTALGAVDAFIYRALPAPVSLGFGGGQVGGATVTGTITLDGNAPAGNAVVALALAPGAPSNIVSLPASATVTAGHSSGTFAATIVAETFSGSLPIVASYGGTSVTGVMSIGPTPAPTLAAISQTCSGQTVVETVTLAEPAPPGGGVVMLYSNSSLATVPASVTVPAGATSATFTFTTGTAPTVQTVTFNASYFGVAALPVSFNVQPAAALTLTIPSSIEGGQSATGTVLVCTPGPAGSSVALSSVGYANVPASVPLSGTSATFTITTIAPFKATTATITATYQGTSVQKTMQVYAPLRCTPPQQLCDCGGGFKTCLSTKMQCMQYCGGVGGL